MLNVAPVWGAAALAAWIVGAPDISGAPPIGATGAAATSDDSAAAWLEQQIAALESDTLELREAAAGASNDDERVTLALLEKRLADTRPGRALTPEQNLRLTQAGIRKFAQAPHAAMGVSFSRYDGDEQGVEIGGTIDGFD